MLVVVEVPEHGLAVLAARGAQRAVRRHRDRVQVAVVAEVIRLQLAVGQIPHLDRSVPAARHDDRVGHVRREAHARHPICVRVFLKFNNNKKIARFIIFFDDLNLYYIILYGDGVFALTERVPQLDGSISRARHDLTVVGREGNAEHVLFVVVELAGRLTSTERRERENKTYNYHSKFRYFLVK